MNKADKFFTKTHCDRCSNDLSSRIMSWFTDNVICMDCSEKETKIRNRLPDHGRMFEGCGFIPSANVGEESK